MRNRTASAALALVFCFVPSAQLAAQHWPKQEYIGYVPLEVPRLIRQTAASERYHLYGDPSDPSYRDAARLDGIDDGRFEVLRQIAVRFAPFMVLNTTAVPMDVRAVAASRESFPLYVDTWNVSAPGSTLLKEATIEFWSVASEPCTQIERAVGNSRKDDCRLLELLDEYHPERPASATDRTEAQQPGTDIFKVIYVDLPGHDPKSWTEEYQDRLSNRLPERYQRFLKSYVHPLLLEVEGPGGVGLELVLQYWFFYPWNDGGNNHEGDWEHINVVVSPLRAVQRNLTADEMKRLLDGEWLDARTRDDQLVIKRLEYYFHGKVLTFDYTAPNVYLPRDDWEREVDSRVKQMAGEDWFWRMIRRRAYEDAEETRINTHPVVHIGADNKGTDQVLAMPGGTNRDSHGSFPFPALYKDVGPAGAAENIETSFDHRDYFAASSEEKVQLLSKWKRGGVVFLADTSHVAIVPDYERVIDLIETDVRVRQEWSWLVLPMRWGYPAVASPFAGVVAHAETGNLAVVGPAFNSGWNQSGATAGYATYEPHRIPRLFPLGWVDNFQNSWGFLNLTLPTIAFFPPIDLLWRFVAAPIRLAVGQQDPTFYPQDRIPFRFFGFTSGVSWMDIPTDYTDLLYNETQFNQIIGRLIGYILVNGSENTVTTGSADYAENVTAAFYQSSFYVGDRFGSQSMLRHSRTDLGSTLEFSDIPDPFEVRGELNFWEFAGSLRYNVFTGGLVPYAKAGYGWSWYRIENITTNSEPLDDPDLDWVRKPSIFPFENLLPNTWHVGAGIEFIVIRTFGIPPRGWDLSVRGEWTLYTNNLGLEISNLPLETLVLLGTTADQLPRERWLTRNEFKLGATVGF